VQTPPLKIERIHHRSELDGRAVTSGQPYALSKSAEANQSTDSRKLVGFGGFV